MTTIPLLPHVNARAAARHLVAVSALANVVTLTDTEATLITPRPSTGEALLWATLASLAGAGRQVDLFQLCNRLDVESRTAVVEALRIMFSGVEGVAA
jgi:hypothetical protein